MKHLFPFSVLAVLLFSVHPVYAIDPSLIIQKTVNITIPTSTPTPTPKLDISNIKLNVTLVALPSVTSTPKISVAPSPTITVSPTSRATATETTASSEITSPTTAPVSTSASAVSGAGVTKRETILFGVIVAFFLVVVGPKVWVYLKKVFTKKTQ